MSLGKMTISEDVFIEIAKSAMQSVDNVVMDEPKEGITGAVKSALQRFMSDITVKTNDKSKDKAETDAAPVNPMVSFEVKLAVSYGARIPEVVAVVRSNIKEEVEKLTGYQVERVDVTVGKLVRAEKDVVSISDGE